jgi:uronate dehydrogenase
VTQRILITGAAGTIGTWLRQSLRRPDRFLTLVDIAPQGPLDAEEQGELIVASITDQAAMDQASYGADVVVHLGGLASGGFAWEQYLEVNINGTRVVLEAALRAGVTKVVLASSNHAVGFYPIVVGAMVPDNLCARPDSHYGISKAAGENLGRHYHDRYGLDVVCLRIGSYLERPEVARNLWSWLSPGDCTRLFEAGIDPSTSGFRVVWGVSANSRGVVSMAEGAGIGYFPVDDADDYAAQLGVDEGADDSWTGGFIGGPYAAPGFDDGVA